MGSLNSRMGVSSLTILVAVGMLIMNSFGFGTDVHFPSAPTGEYLTKNKVYARRVNSSAFVLVFHRTDTHI